MAGHTLDGFANPLQAAPPFPADPWEAARWEHSRLRRRMLYGLWQPDAQERLRKAMGLTRSDVMGDADISANPFSEKAHADAALYDRKPKILHEDPVAAELLDKIVREGGYWAMMQRGQRDCLGLRELLMRVDVEAESPDKITATYTPVYPDMVIARATPETPDRPVYLKWAVMRDVPTTLDPDGSRRTEKQWTWEVWSIEEERPYHQILSTASHSRGRDISELFGLPPGGLVGDDYPAMRAGLPFIPFAMYHAARTGCLWDSWADHERVEGTLTVSTLWSFYAHCVRNASWPQRWTLGAEPFGSGSDGEGDAQRSAVVADPANVLMMRQSDDMEGQPTIGQWATAANPKELADAITIYEARLRGGGSADFRRVSGDPRSGYALAIDREGRREAQRRYTPLFEPVDVEMLGYTAALVNRALGMDLLPETGWGVEYQALPQSPEEQKATREHVLALSRENLISKSQAQDMLGIEAVEEDEQAAVARRIGEITSALDIVKAASAGDIPPESAIALMVTTLNFTDEQARAALAGAGGSFKVADRA